MVALDFGDLFTSRQVRDLLHGAESLAGKEIDLDAITKVITSIKGVTFTVQATDRLNGKMRVDFGESPGPLKQVAKALLFEVIEKNGMMLDDEIKNWRVVVEAKAIALEGRMSTKGLRTLTDLIPFPTETIALNEASPKARRDRSCVGRVLLDSGLEGHNVEEVLPAHQPARRRDPYRSQGCRVAKARADDGRQGGAGDRSPAGAQR